MITVYIIFVVRFGGEFGVQSQNKQDKSALGWNEGTLFLINLLINFIRFFLGGGGCRTFVSKSIFSFKSFRIILVFLG